MLSSVLGRCYFGDKGNLGFRGFVCSSPNRLTRLVCVGGARGYASAKVDFRRGLHSGMRSG